MKSRFEPVIERPHRNGDGIQKIYRFPNNYGASVVRFKLCRGDSLRHGTQDAAELYGSYTDNENEWELGVVHFRGNSNGTFSLVYDTPITSDVLGHLRDEQVEEVLAKIDALPRR